MTFSLKFIVKLSVNIRRLAEIVKELPKKAIEFLMALLDRWYINLHF